MSLFHWVMVVWGGLIIFCLVIGCIASELRTRGMSRCPSCQEKSVIKTNAGEHCIYCEYRYEKYNP